MSERRVYRVFISGTSDFDYEKDITRTVVLEIAYSGIFEDMDLPGVGIEPCKYEQDITDGVDEEHPRLQTAPSKHLIDSEISVLFIGANKGSDPRECELEPFREHHFESAFIEELALSEYKYENDLSYEFDTIYFVNDTKSSIFLEDVKRNINFTRRYHTYNPGYVSRNELEFKGLIHRIIRRTIRRMERNRAKGLTEVRKSLLLPVILKKYCERPVIVSDDITLVGN